MCGEKQKLVDDELDELGSPPHVRGKVVVMSADEANTGITPACAGKSYIEINRKPEERDHPRMCGEKFPPEVSDCCSPGSPPHVRGKDGRITQEECAERITPACAGKRDISISTAIISGDHPRMCGEKDCLPLLNSANRGSPPHVRGKVFFTSVIFILCGITPACAGKRASEGVALTLVWDHPRMCGEKALGTD